MTKYELLSKKVFKLKNQSEYKGKFTDFIVEEEYSKLVGLPSFEKIEFEINPFLYSEQRKISDKYPLFYIALPEHLFSIEKIYGKSIVIKNLEKDIPDLALEKIMKINIIEEIQVTNQIEGIKSTRKEISEALINIGSEKKRRFKSILNQYLMTVYNPKKMIFELSDFRDLYDKIVEDEIEDKDRPDGKLFRSEPVYVKSNYDGKAVHTGDYDENEIVENLGKLIKIMNDQEIGPLIKAIVCHYILEYIHPFYDGNGRLGRYILSSYLSFKVDKLSAISISQAIHNNKKKYLDSFVEVSKPNNRGDLTIFISNLLEMIIEGQEKIINQLYEAKDTIENIVDYIDKQNLDENLSSILKIYLQDYHFKFANEAISNIELKEITNLTRTKIDKFTKELEQMDYLIRVSNNPIAYTFNYKKL